MRPIIVIGTRPEAIKLAPVARALPEADVVLTGQHPAEMVVPTLEYFGVPIAEQRTHIAGLDLNQSFRLAHQWLAERVAGASCVIAQGDTTTAAAAAQAAFYAGVPFVHVEAGLRTYEATPYPEEFNRRLCAIAATVHCAPTEGAAENLRRERVNGRIEVTGNTVVDAIRFAMHPDEPPRLPLVLVTCHRRENFGKAFENICNAVRHLAATHHGYRFTWAVHPNPNARPKAMPGVELIAQPAYHEWIWLIERSKLIITDSGGIQEECAVLSRPCIVLRGSTERPEAVECGSAHLVGDDTNAIVAKADEILDGKWKHTHPHPFGDGRSGERIANIVRELTNTESCPPSPALTATL